MSWKCPNRHLSESHDGHQIQSCNQTCYCRPVYSQLLQQPQRLLDCVSCCSISLLHEGGADMRMRKLHGSEIIREYSVRLDLSRVSGHVRADCLVRFTDFILVCSFILIFPFLLLVPVTETKFSVPVRTEERAPSKWSNRLGYRPVHVVSSTRHTISALKRTRELLNI